MNRILAFAFLALSLQTALAQGKISRPDSTFTVGKKILYGERARASVKHPCKGYCLTKCAEFVFGNSDQITSPNLNLGNGAIAPGQGIGLRSAARPVTIWRVPLDTPDDVFNQIKAIAAEKPNWKVVRGFEDEIDNLHNSGNTSFDADAED